MDGREKTEKVGVWSELKSYKRRYYFNQLLKGSILLFTIVLSVYLLVNTLEFSFRFNSGIRVSLLILLILSFGSSFYLFILSPLLILLGQKAGMSDEEAALRIGKSFPVIKDRLLNLIQLQKLGESNSLLEAGINQKSLQVSNVSYKSSIHLSENRKYLRYILSPVSLIALLALSYPNFLIDPTERIIKFNQEFVPEAPFEFNAEYQPYAFKNEDFTISLGLEGRAQPESAYLISNGRKFKMIPLQDGTFEHTFKKVQENRNIRFEAAGFFSIPYEIVVVDRPNLQKFNVQLIYPDYTGRLNERLSNIGNLEVPEGTIVGWQFAAFQTESLEALFLTDSVRKEGIKSNDNLFELENKFLNSDNYILELKNKYSVNKDLINYSVRVIKDAYPEINLSLYQDTILYTTIALGGNISDDYGIQRLSLRYSLRDKNGGEQPIRTLNIPVSKQASQGFYYQWNIDSIGLEPGEQLTYYLEVWDNDGVNGSKSSKTGQYQFKIPSEEDLKQELSNSSNDTENQIQKSLNDASELEEMLRKAEERLKEKKELDWEDEKLIKEILDQKEEMEKALKELREKNKSTNMQRDRFSPQNQNFQERSKQLEQLMDEIFDENTRKMFEELQKLLDDQTGVEQLQEMMDQLSRKQNTVKREIERSLELYKRLKLEQELNEAVKTLNKTADEQMELSRETENQEKSSEELQKEQERLMDSFKKLTEELNEINNQNQELKNPGSLPDQNDLKKEIEEQQQKSLDLLNKLEEEKDALKEETDSAQENSTEEQNTEGEETESKEQEESKESEKNENGESEEESDKNDESEKLGDPQEQSQNPREQSQKSQERASQKMKQMAKEIEQMQMSMEAQQAQENIDDLRNIVHNLLKLSFDQETLMEAFREVNESDPGFVPLSQDQLKLRDDAKVIQDSLTSLAQRVGQLGNVIMREVNSMNEHMDNSMESLKERRKYRAVSEQQFAMTSMNNLALQLDNQLDMMMQAMGQQSGKMKKKSQNNRSLGDMQQQLNDQIKELQESGKSGRELSEELAKLAAQQARIRKALQEMQERMDQMDLEGNEIPGGDLPAKMEQTEMDLVNKRLTEQMIRRQQDIVTRLLQAENAMRERELDEERKGQTAQEYDKLIPRSFDEYLKQKQKEIEMLKTLPPRLYPYYKKEVSDYFKRIGEGLN